MSIVFQQYLEEQLTHTKAQGLFKQERAILSAQQANVSVQIPGESVARAGQAINLCANNYLGLANHPAVIAAAQDGLAQYGFGVASVRFICGTQDIHQQLEKTIAEYLGFEGCILYPSCFDANGGLFETLLGPEDAVISDSLNHASIIDGIRLSKAMRFRYDSNNMNALESSLRQATERNARFKLIVTDGVFSMDGVIANLAGICDLAERYDAMVMVDDCHATGFLGASGKGSHEHCGVLDRVHIMTGTLGKALGGASGGYTVAKAPVIEWLRQRSRPYLFSNSIAPPIVTASLKVFDLMRTSDDLRTQLWANAQYFRQQMSTAGFRLIGADHPIIPVMIGDAQLATKMAARLLQEGVYVVGFSYPVVPQDQARIRTQMSAAHSKEQLDYCIDAFIRVGQELGVIA